MREPVSPAADADLARLRDGHACCLSPASCGAHCRCHYTMPAVLARLDAAESQASYEVAAGWRDRCIAAEADVRFHEQIEKETYEAIARLAEAVGRPVSKENYPVLAGTHTPAMLLGEVAQVVLARLNEADGDDANEWWRELFRLKRQGLTPGEAQAAYDAAEPVPVSEERIKEIVEYAVSGGRRVAGDPKEVRP